MREIKFRGKGEKGKWIFGDLNHGICTGNIFINGCFVDDSTVGQYTGLKDKNGKEIYEGDVVDKQYHNGKLSDGIGIVCFGYGSDSDGWLSECWLGWLAGASSLCDVAEACTVIGNIHDNPEPMGVQE
jgi:hypothetical protein